MSDDSARLPAPANAPRARRAGAGVTVHDVARVAQVSAITVSRAVNAPERLLPETLARVRAAIAETGYVPNLLAKQLNANRSAHLVAALVPTLTGTVFSGMIQSLTDTLDARGYQLLLGQSGYAHPREDELLDALIGRRPDGIVLTGVHHSDLARRRLRAAGIPVVETWDLTDDPIDMVVGFSHADVGRRVCEALHARGYRRLALITATDTRAEQRCAAFITRATELGLPVPQQVSVEAPPTRLGHGREALARLWAQAQPPDAVFCSSDIMALGVLIEAGARGIDVPRQLGVVGFGDLEFAASAPPALSSVRVDGPAIGATAATLLLACARGEAPAPRRVDVGFTVIERASTISG
ncbi:LacI family DNA-binding transcriptional regulator [Achromobacter sp. GG226]|uniref:LacI family DNA-binding transcriptional regulator n=1 Tax=Verticiella alkaliphila TaxID=2779529 RepID=UPI001C0D8101|nr:LacI family DNA-binding transcriptional regulator [Verticiella sp. GG226]MBU4610627.1 LacI family DNA-binding transcriptional regulator [Verticiella sp. GG226]